MFVFMILISVLVVVILLLVVFAYKNNLVYEHSSKALGIISKQDDATVLWDLHFSDGYYNRHFYNPFKWTFEQMYPGLKELEEK